MALVGLTHVGFGFDKIRGWSSEALDNVVLASDESCSDKEEFFLEVVVLSEIGGVRGASGVDLEKVANFLRVFSVEGVVMANLVLLVSAK